MGNNEQKENAEIRVLEVWKFKVEECVQSVIVSREEVYSFGK